MFVSYALCIVCFCVYLYADAESLFLCWIRREFLEECCHSLYSVPGADGTVNDQENTEGDFNIYYSI